jgi:hypothetical protein
MALDSGASFSSAKCVRDRTSLPYSSNANTIETPSAATQLPFPALR